MSYKTTKLVRRRGGARISRRRKRFMHRASNYASLAYKAYKGYKMLRGIINSELKKFDLTAGYSPTTTWAAVSLVNIGEGDDNYQREGVSVLAKYISVKYTIDMNASATSTIVRIMVIVDKGDPNGTVPATSLIFTNTAALTSAISSDWTQRYVVLHDRIYDLSINGDRNASCSFYKPLNFHIRYTGTGTTAFDQNAIYVCYFSSEATNLPNFTMTHRLAYYDN